MIWSQHDPAAEAVAEVDDSGAADKTDDVWKCGPKSQDENLSRDANGENLDWELQHGMVSLPMCGGQSSLNELIELD